MVIRWVPNNGKRSIVKPERCFIDQFIDGTGIRKEELGRAIVIVWDTNYSKRSSVR